MEHLIETQVQVMLLQRANKVKWFLPLAGKSRKQLFNNALRQTEDGEALCKDHASQWQSSIIPLPECIKDSCASDVTTRKQYCIQHEQHKDLKSYFYKDQEHHDGFSVRIYH